MSAPNDNSIGGRRKRTRKKHRAFRPRLVALICAIVVVAAAVVWASASSLRHWRSRHLVDRAERFLAAGDIRSAALVARSLLESDNSNVGAMRALAEASEAGGQKTALDWRRRVVAQAPDSLADRIELARSALHFDDLRLAEFALDGVPPAQRDSAAYHEAAAQVAFEKKEVATAEAELLAALRLDASNRSYQLQLAVVQLQSTDPSKHDQARALLRDRLTDRATRLTAIKALLQDAVNRRDPSVIEYADTLTHYEEASFQDRLLCVGLLQQVHSPAFTAALTKAQDEAVGDTDKLTRLLSWMSENNLSMLALDWVKRIPSDNVRKAPVFVALADCYVAARDCNGLTEWCHAISWGALDFLRHAYLARAAKDCGDSARSELEWTEGLRTAGNSAGVETLQRAAAKWNWKDQSLALLWNLADAPDTQKEALLSLYRFYYEQRDTSDLYRVASRLATIAPDDAQVQNSFAQLSLLLNVNIERARAIAQRLYQSEPGNPDVASTYACALWMQGRKREALQAMQKLGEQQLRRPEVAAYYAVALAKAGQDHQAIEFAQIGRTARLLPEEEALLREVAVQ